MSIFNRHTAYEQLVTEHVDGLLDEAGEAKLRQHLATCASCAVEVREQQAVRTLLTAQPMVAVPRSFALPYAPRQAATDESRETGWLRGMQVATATAALVLVTLVGVNVVDPTGNASPSTDAQALSAVIESSDTQEIAAAEGIPAPEGDGAAPPVARTPDTGFSTSAPSGFAPDGGA
jgi:anti-sigma factor RsiW